jgi:hypothetical protein
MYQALLTFEEMLTNNHAPGAEGNFLIGRSLSYAVREGRDECSLHK